MKALADVIDFKAMIKRNLIRFVPDLRFKDPQEFEYEQVTTICHSCSNHTQVGWKYRLIGTPEWSLYEPEWACGDCEMLQKLKLETSDHKKKIRELLIERFWYIPDDLKNAGFKSFERKNKILIKALEDAVSYIKKFRECPPEQRHNLLIMGNPGTGKSHLGVAIVRTLRSAGYTVGFITTGKLLALIKETYRQGAQRSENEIMADLQKFDLLVIDDLGAEAGTRDEFSWTKAKLFDIVNTRIGKPTIYTTNFNDLNISEAVGERVASRLYNNTQFIDMFTDDYRKSLRVV